jgi:hypothetical protein
MHSIKKIPSTQKIMQVYAFIAVVLYSWSLLRFFWRLPSFIISSTVGEIVVMYSYLVIVNFFESLVILFAPILFSMLLPSRWFFERFVTKSTFLLAMGFVYLAYIADHVLLEIGPLYGILRNAPFAALVIILLAFLLDEIPFLRRIIIELIERLTVFLYIIIPFTMISLFLVVFRNIF